MVYSWVVASFQTINQQRRCQVAYQAREKAKYLHGDENLPLLYEDEFVWVYKNPSNEIFVENIRSGVKMRINPSYDGGLQFSAVGRVEPTLINNMPGWRVGPR